MEENNKYSSRSEEEINLKKLGIIFILGLVTLFGAYFLFGGNLSYSITGATIVSNINLNSFIEENYFEEHSLLNSNFSEGLYHWSACDDSSKCESKVKLSLNTKDYHSTPQSLQLECPSSVNGKACKIHYHKEANSQIIEYVDYNLKSDIWLGTHNPKKITLSFWYKGSTTAVFLLSLDSKGNYKDFLLKDLSSKNSNYWSFLEDSEVLSDDIRALAFEITSPGIIIDDVTLTVE